VKATKVTTGLAESNGSLLPVLWRDSLHITCGLTACTPESAPGPTLGDEYGKTTFLRGSLGPHETELKRHLPSGLVYPILQGSPVCPTHTDGQTHTDHATPSAAMGRIYDFHVMQPNKCMF